MHSSFATFIRNKKVLMVNHKGANPVENKNQQIKKEMRIICIQSRGNKINLGLDTDQMLLFQN
jgi:hypothetical protein